MKYDFHRDFYPVMLESINDNSTTFLLGTRKCGKTVCLQQIQETLPTAKYIDFKSCTPDERLKIIDEILDAVKNDNQIVYLLDEITSVTNYDVEICKIAEAYTQLKNENTRIVFSGSQSVALGVCADRAFAGNTNIVPVDFLTYSEFLRFKNIQEVSANSYNRYLTEVFDFYDGFRSLKQYLEGCINETIISNMKAAEVVLGNETPLTKEDTDFLIDVCYQTLFNLHNHVSTQRFFADNKLQKDIPNYFREVCENLDNKTIAEKINQSFIGSYNTIRTKDVETIRYALVFLERCGLITITPVTDNIYDVPDIMKNIRTGNRPINLKTELFNSFNISIKYPMFYVQIIKDILKEDMPEKLPNPILGSIVECNARGLLNNGFELKVTEFKDNGEILEKEVDLVDIKTSTATELTISKRHTKHFDIIPADFKKIMLTRDVNSIQDGITRIPYYEYLYGLSAEKYKVKGTTNQKNNGSSITETSKPTKVLEEIESVVSDFANKIKNLSVDIETFIENARQRAEDSFNHLKPRSEPSLKLRG